MVVFGSFMMLIGISIIIVALLFENELDNGESI